MPDWNAQVGALQAQWVIRYLSPSSTPWHHLLDYYLLPQAGPRGRLEVLSKLNRNPYRNRLTPDSLPNPQDPNSPITSMRARKANSHPILKFWRSALTHFQDLEWTETRQRTGASTLSHSIFDSLTHPPPSNVTHVNYWKNACGLHHYRDVINPHTGDFYTALELHRSITGSLRTRNQLPKLHKGMTLPIALAELDAIKQHIGTINRDEAAPFLANLTWTPAAGDIIGWTELQDKAGVKRSMNRNTLNFDEHIRYGKVVSIDTSTSSARILPVRINHFGTPVPITPTDKATTPQLIQQAIDNTLPIVISLKDLRPTIGHKRRVWGLQEELDLHPTELKLAEIPELYPAVAFHKIRVSDIAKRLSSRKSRNPSAQLRWSSKLGLQNFNIELNWEMLFR